MTIINRAGELLARYRARLKTVRCVRCDGEFKQVRLNQKVCSRKCRGMLDRRLIPPVYEEFESFCKKHFIPRRAIIPRYLWERCAGKRDDEAVSIRMSNRLAVKLRAAMDTLRQGFYVRYRDGLRFVSPPWEPRCPIEHIYCRGVILPRDCPRRHPECLYTHGRWKEILKFRGEYETALGKNRNGNATRRSPNAIIGAGVGRATQNPNGVASHKRRATAADRGIRPAKRPWL